MDASAPTYHTTRQEASELMRRGVRPEEMNLEEYRAEKLAIFGPNHKAYKRAHIRFERIKTRLANKYMKKLTKMLEEDSSGSE